jgi:hypothetical protein
MRSNLFKRFNWWMAIISILLAVILCAISGFAIWSLYPAYARQPVPTAIMMIIPPPTSTPIQLPTVPTTPTIPANQSNNGGIAIGNYVQINGTGSDGLRLRSGPGVDNPMRFIGMDAEVFLVKDGPKDSDGFTWWYLVAPYDQNRSGWAASKYLEIVSQQP